MKKETRYGTHHITSDKQLPFISLTQAIMAMQMMQMLYSLQGYLTSSSINAEHGRVQLTIHFEDKPFPVVPTGYKYTWKDITSHMYWSDATNKSERVRCIDYYFEFDK